MLKVVMARVDELVLNERNPRRMRPERWRRFLCTLAAEALMVQARPVIARVEDRVVKDDDDLAAEILAELAARGANLDLTGFERSETDALMRRLVRRDKDPDAVPLPVGGAPKTKIGDVLEFGDHRAMCGDAMNPDHVAELLKGVQPHLIATDPPYGVELDHRWRDQAGLNGPARGADRQVRRRRRTADHQTTTIVSDTRADWSAAYELVPSCLVIYAWHASSHACEVQAGLELVGFEVAQQLVWDKGLFALSRSHYNWQHECCFYARRRGSKVPWYGPANQSTVWQAASPKMVAAGRAQAADQKVDHPTQKPVVLFTRPIENHLQPGEAIYDPFAGSGTALIAAEMTGRRAYLMELDGACCDLIRRRWEEFTNGR